MINKIFGFILTGAGLALLYVWYTTPQIVYKVVAWQSATGWQTWESCKVEIYRNGDQIATPGGTITTEVGSFSHLIWEETAQQWTPIINTDK